MKTPKRSYDQNLNHLVRAHYTDKGKERRSRWKRKNRISQLKRSLSKYKGGDFLPWYSYERHAYKLIQRLRRPKDEADCNKHNEYTQTLEEIVKLLSHAVAASSFRAGKAWQKQYGKEEP